MHVSDKATWSQNPTSKGHKRPHFGHYTGRHHCDDNLNSKDTLKIKCHKMEIKRNLKPKSGFNLQITIPWVFNSDFKSVRLTNLKRISDLKNTPNPAILGLEFFRTCNVLPFSCTHSVEGKVKDPRYMQNKKDPRIYLIFCLD